MLIYRLSYIGNYFQNHTIHGVRWLTNAAIGGSFINNFEFNSNVNIKCRREVFVDDRDQAHYRLIVLKILLKCSGRVKTTTVIYCLELYRSRIDYAAICQGLVKLTIK